MGLKKHISLIRIKVWEPFLLSFLAFVGISSILVFKLSSIVPGFSAPEVAYISSASSINKLVNNPLYLPHKFINLLVFRFYPYNIFLSRLVSVLFGLFVIGLFYYVVSKWHSKTVALLSLLMLVCSSWLMHNNRLAVPYALLCASVIAAIAYGTWIRHTNRSGLAIALGVLLFGLLLYTPGMIWLILIGVWWQRKAISSHIKQSSFSLLPAFIIGGVLIGPLLIAIARSPELVKPFVGLPVGQLATISTILKNIALVPVQIFVRGPNDPVIWLGRLPLLDIFSAAMCIIGVYSFYSQRKLDRAKILFGIFILGCILAGLRGSVSLSFAIVPVYLFIASGIAYMLKQWLTVFPSNPLARSIGIVLIVAAVGLSSFYNLKQYFIAWPKAPATKQSFQIHKT